MKITSYPITRDIRIGRIKSDPCEIVFVLNEDGAPMDLTGKVLELVFLTGNHAMLTLTPDDVDGNKAVFALTEEEKNKLYANLIYISVKLDGVTIGEGRFEWGSTHGDKSELPKAIGINVNNVTESIEWFEVIVGPRGPMGELTEPDRVLLEEAMSGAEQVAEDKIAVAADRSATQTARNEAVGARNEAVPAANTATEKAGIATAAAEAAAVSAATIDKNGEVAEGDVRLVSGSKIFDWYNLGETGEVPLGYKNGTYNTYLTRGYSYYDSRCIVNSQELLQSINIVAIRTAGQVNIIAISTAGDILHSETKGLTLGINTVAFDALPVISQPFYVGIQLLTAQAEVGTYAPANGEGFSYLRLNSATNWTYTAYRLAYSINIANGGVSERISKIEILTKSETSHIQSALYRSRKVTLDAKEFIIEEPIVVPDGTTLSGVFGKSILKSTLNSDIVIVDGRTDIEISNIRIKGTLPNYAYGGNGINSGTGIIGTESDALSNAYMGDQHGIRVTNSERVLINGIQFHNLTGTGLIVDRVGRDYIHGLKASQLFFFNCYKGIFTTNEHEYSHYTDLMVSLCQIGIHCNSGNISFIAPIITRCRIGAMFTGAGRNHAHGIMSSAEIKHNQMAGLFFSDVVYGQYLPALYLEYCDIISRNSQKLFFPSPMIGGGGVELDCTDSIGLPQNKIQSHFTTAATGITIINQGNFTIT